jgi:PTH1 family peptidyl-tRNA hydrolase
MRMIVGLGNPGEKYKKNRHNLGFILLDDLIKDLNNEWVFEKKFKCMMSRVGEDIYIKPQDYMNRSGEVIKKIMNYYNIGTDRLIVVHDDVDIDLGKYKKQTGSGSAGHKGVQSIIDSLDNNDFTRIRVGVGRPDGYRINTEDWVLMNFSEIELDKIRDIVVLKALINIK